MSDYAKAKGRTIMPTGNVPTGPQDGPKALSPAEIEEVARNKAFVEEYMPELVPIIRDYHQEGLLPGWRSVANCQCTGGTAAKAGTTAVSPAPAEGSSHVT